MTPPQVGDLSDPPIQADAEADARLSVGLDPTVEQLRRATQVDNVGIFFFTPDGRITDCNDAFLRMSGLARERIARGEVRWDAPTPDEWMPASRRALEEFRLHGRTQPYERECVRPDGSRWWGLFAATRIGPDEGVQYVIDVTQRHRADERRHHAEQQLAESRELLRLVVDNARDYAILSTDLQRHITSWNVGAERLIGASEREMLGRCADELFTPEERAAEIPEREAATALASGRAADERWHVRRDGTRFWGSGLLMAMHGEGGRPVGFVKIFRDETEARQTQEALQESRVELWQALQENERARHELEAASRAKDHFLAVLSHELRTPLTPVLVAAQALAMRQDLPDAVRNALEMIQRNVRLEAQFIDDLLDLTHISRGTLAVDRAPMDLHQVVGLVLESCRAEIDSKQQRLSVQLDAERHTFDGDADRMRQAVRNVLNNAIKFTPAGGAITVRSWNRDDCFVLEIVDTGIGIVADRLPTVFEAFAQAGDWVAREYGGLGLGLAISRAAVEAHGGRMSVESAGPNQGTVVRIELPLNLQIAT